MKDGRSNKAVAGIIGLFLILVIIVIAAGIYQQSIVPINEENKEIDHQRQVSGQMEDLRSAILSSSSEASKTSIDVNLGITYENGILGLFGDNFKTPAPGSLISRDFNRTMKVKNAEGLGSSQNYWTGRENCPDPGTAPSEEEDHCFDTDLIKYSPDYRRQQLAPDLKYENSVVFSEQETLAGDKQIVPRTGQNIVNGKDISLISIDAPTLNTTSTSQVTVDVIPVSASSNTISITNSSEDPISIEVPTSTSIDVWKSVLCEQFNQPRNTSNCKTNGTGFIKNVTEKDPSTPQTDAIVIKMEEGQVYNLKLSRIALMTRTQRTSVEQTEPAYVAWSSGDRINIRENSIEEIPAQVRDKYNNPKIGVRTKASALVPNESTGELDCIGSFDVYDRSLNVTDEKENCDNNPDARQPGTRVSGDEGRLSYFYQVPEVEEDAPIEIKIEVLPGDVLSNSVEEKVTKVKNSLKKMSSHRKTQQPVNIDLRRFKHSVITHNPDDTDKSLRILDLRAPHKKVSVNNEFYLTAVLENDGTQPIDLQSANVYGEELALYDEDGNRYNTEAKPTEMSGTIKPGERLRWTFKLKFNNPGLKHVELTTETSSLTRFKSIADSNEERSVVFLYVSKKSSRMESYLIENQADLEETTQRPSRFKDNDSNPNEDFETRNIPPFENQNGTFVDTSEGNLENFENFGDDTQEVNVDDFTSSDDVNVGIAHFRVPEVPAYTVDINYTTESGDAYALFLVGPNGEESQDNIMLAIPGGKNSEENRKFHLSPEQSRIINNQNEVYSVLSNPSGTNIDISKMNIKTTEDIIKITEPKTNITDIRMDSKNPTIIKSNITNKGNGSRVLETRLYKASNTTPSEVDSSTEFEPIKSKKIVSNPQQTKVITFKHYESEQGTHTYRIGRDNDNIIGITYNN